MKVIIVTFDKDEIELSNWRKEFLDAMYDIFGDQVPAGSKEKKAKPAKQGFLTGVSTTPQKQPNTGTKQPAKVPKGKKK